jgi:ATPase family associated with various cellular activities (AAA)
LPGTLSSAGTKSTQGDYYQLLVALHWVIRLLGDNEIDYIQAESNGLPGIDGKVTVDDVVIVYVDGHNRYIQAKKNQSKYAKWSLSDLEDELPKIRDQLEANADAIVELYSRTPFGDLQSLVDASCEYPDLVAFQRDAGTNLKEPMSKLAELWQRSEERVFGLLRKIKFGPHHAFSDWERCNKQDLDCIVTQVDMAIPVLESFINSHQLKLSLQKFTIQREDVIEHLGKMGLVLAPRRSEAEILEQFQQASLVGRDWPRTIGGHQINRPELGELIRAIETGASMVLVTDRPGSGKTCLLLDLADHIEQNPKYGLLFIKGDRFTQPHSKDDFQSSGLPINIVGSCGRLSEHRQVVVIIDSLDVLSQNREHGALGMFLCLIDRLRSIQNVTVVSACRSFDLQYDPLLRDRKWEHKIQLDDFDFDDIVVPLLNEWGVSEDQIDDELKHLLQLPQNLRLFKDIAQRNAKRPIGSAYELHEVYLDEVVRKDKRLGDTAIAVLQHLADQLLNSRIRRIPLAAFPGDEPIRRVLVSNAILHQDSDGGIGFGHQTMFDTLLVYSSLARGQDLASFIKEHPPFPFLRPAVRTFIFHLRTKAPGVFSKQIWQALAEENIAYHFKRLIVESLAEISPGTADWVLIRRLFQREPELFQRLFYRVEGDAWWRLIVDHWLPLLSSPVTDRKWYTLLTSHLGRWMNSHPEAVVGLWQRALSEGWNKEFVAQRINIDLQKFNHWRTEGITELIESLLQEDKTDREMLGQVLSLYVEFTNQGDDLVWGYIVKDVEDQEAAGLRIGDRLHCESHRFHDKHFLRDRLIQSPMLLDMAVRSLEGWATREKLRLLNGTFLNTSSWGRRHSSQSRYRVDSLSELLDGIEWAITHHAKADDGWWHANEQCLRIAREESLLYFLVKSYAAIPETNVEGMSVILTDKAQLYDSRLQHELCELIQAGYHLLEPEIQEANQRILLNKHEDKDPGKGASSELELRTSYEYLICIPVIFRLPESQAFVNRFRLKYGAYLPKPRIDSWGGREESSVSLEQLMALSTNKLFCLLDYYNDYYNGSTHPADYLKGGRDMVADVLCEAAALDPVRYLALVPAMEHHGIWNGYLNNLFDGITRHLRYRYGSLQPPQDWSSSQPEPDGTDLARHLLDLAEKRSGLRENGHTIARMLEASSEVLEDSESTERLVFLWFWVMKHPDPEEDHQVIWSAEKKGISTEDLRAIAINSVRGVAAGGAMSLCNRLLELEREPPDLMFPLLRHFACDSVQAVPAALLAGLPYLTHKRSSWGRQLFNDIFTEPQTHLWPLAERYLYRQYHEYFEYVAPLLHRMRTEAPEESAGTWGRIMTLASLSGHIDNDDLFHQLESVKSIDAREGAAQVFTSNLNNHKARELCKNGLQCFIQSGEMTDHIQSIIEIAFDPKKHGRVLDESFALRFIDSIKPSNNYVTLRHLFDWIADRASRDPISALEVCEQLINKLSELEHPHQRWETKPLISALSSILREADDTGDEALIYRAVRLQDQLLMMDIHGIDEYFEQAGRL